MGFIDDTEEAVYNVSPSDNVYAYFMFIVPAESHKEGGAFTWDTSMAWILLILNFFFQGLLLGTVYEEVVVANKEWEHSIMTPKIWSEEYRKEPDFLGPDPIKCNPGGSLCVRDGGNFSCAPPSVQLTGQWNLLDTNGDGIWTREEVVAAQKEIQCQFIVNPVEVFDVFIKFLKNREKILWLHPDIKEGKAIPKPYFNFAAGDIIMCGYRDRKVCPNLLKRGFFHAPLKHHTAPRVGKTIDSALKYCDELLRPGGTCERTLPSTYSVWRISSEDQCGDPGYSKFVYKNPGSGVVKSLLEVDFSSREDYELSQTSTFKTYKTIIIAMWLFAMVMEFKDLIIVFTWCARFPDAKDFGGDAVIASEEDGGLNTIQGVTSSHRMAVIVMSIARLFLVCLLTYVGTSFLLKCTGYIDLLMDAVTLVFIVEIANILYGQSLRPQVRDEAENMTPMTVPMYGIKALNTRPALVDMLWFFGVWIASMWLIYSYGENTVTPVFDALQCSCLGIGDNCVEAHRFSYDFWYDYWKNVVPQVFTDVAQMKSEAGAAAPAPAAAPAAAFVEVASLSKKHVLSSMQSSLLPGAM